MSKLETGYVVQRLPFATHERMEAVFCPDLKLSKKRLHMQQCHCNHVCLCQENCCLCLSGQKFIPNLTQLAGAQTIIAGRRIDNVWDRGGTEKLSEFAHPNLAPHNKTSKIKLSTGPFPAPERKRMVSKRVNAANQQNLKERVFQVAVDPINFEGCWLSRGRFSTGQDGHS